MKRCYKDKDRICDDNCSAYFEDAPHANCLELSAKIEGVKRMKTFSLSNDINSYYLSQFTEALNAFGEDLRKALHL